MNLTHAIPVKKKLTLATVLTFFLLVGCTAFRLAMLTKNGLLHEMVSEEGPIYLMRALYVPFWKGLFEPDWGYLALFVNLYSYVVAKAFGVIDHFASVTKIGGVLIYSLFCTFFLSKNFEYLGSFAVRLLFCCLIICHDCWELFLLINFPYVFGLASLYLLSVKIPSDTFLSWTRLLFLSVLVVLTAFSKPLVLVIFPLLAIKAVIAFRDGEKKEALLCSFLLIAFLGQVVLTVLNFPVAYHSNSHHFTFWFAKLMIENWIAIAGMGSVALLIPNRLSAFASYDFLKWGYLFLGSLAQVFWIGTFFHSFHTRKLSKSLPLLVPIVSLPLLLLIVMSGHPFVVASDWNLLSALRESGGEVTHRYLSFASIFCLLGMLAAFNYWACFFNLAKLKSFTLVSLVFFLSLNVYCFFALFSADRYPDFQSHWSTFRPLLSKDSYCIPMGNFPYFWMARNCGILHRTSIPNFGVPGKEYPIPKIKPEWNLNAIMFGWEIPQSEKKPLFLSGIDETNNVVQVASILPDSDRYQYFPMNEKSSRLKSLRLTTIGGGANSIGRISIYIFGTRQ